MSDPYTLGRLTRTRTNGATYWSYCIVWWIDGKRQRYSLGTTDRVAAEASARRVWAGLNRQAALCDMTSIIDAYLDSLNGARDEKRKREAWVAAKPYWGALRPETVDLGVSLAYPAWRNRAANTVRQELSLIRTACNWAVKGKHIAAAPPMTLPTMPESSVGHLTKEDFRAFLLGCGYPHVKLFSMLAVTTGGRKTALLQAQWPQVDLDRALMDLNEAGRVQNRKHRATVPLNDMIMPALRAAKEAALSTFVIEHHGKPLLDIKKGIAAASRRSGVKVHPHMFRHSAAVWMAEDRVPMAEIAAFLGHRDINVTIRIYARYHPDYLRAAARSLTW